MLKTFCFFITTLIVSSIQVNPVLGGIKQRLQDFVQDKKRSNDFLGAEMAMGDFGDVKKQFIEMIREDSDDQELVLKAFSGFSNAGGVFGDPHFVLPLTPEVTICFNWKEYSDEFDNLITTSTHLVNARMLPRETYSPITMSTKPRVFVSALAFVIPEYRLNIVIHPDRVSIKFYGKEHTDETEFDLERGQNFTHKTVSIKNDLFLEGVDGSHYITLYIGDTLYRIILRTYAPRPHINFYFNNLTHSGDGETVNGLAGQFYNKDIQLNHLDDEKATIKIGDTEVRAHRHKLDGHAPFSGMAKDCWLVTQDSQHFFMKDRQKFQVETLVAEPTYFKAD